MLLFVYGTLKKGFSGHSILNKTPFKGKGYIHAHLYDLGVGYPAVVIYEKPVRERVAGEIYDVQDDLLEELDEYEGFYPDNSEESLFIRKEMDVELEDRTKVKAYVYYMTDEKLKIFFAVPVKGENWTESDD